MAQHALVALGLERTTKRLRQTVLDGMCHETVDLPLRLIGKVAQSPLNRAGFLIVVIRHVKMTLHHLTAGLARDQMELVLQIDVEDFVARLPLRTA